jgi:hypothetical protein
VSEGLLYEPRSFWSIANVAGQTYDQTVRMDRRHFYNGGRYPIEIRRIAIAGVNYLLSGPPIANGAVGWNESASVIERVRVSFAAPQRFYFSSRRTPLAAGMAPRATAQPPVGAPSSSLWGQCNLTFDQPLVLPRTGTIELDLSAHTPWRRPGEVAVVEAEPTQATVVWQEVGGMFAGSGRSHTMPLFTYTGPTHVADPAEKWPYPPDGYGTGGAPVNPSRNWWPAQSSFPAGGPRGFSRFESTRSGSTEVSELRTHIDQLDYDAALGAAFGATRACPLSMRTGCRVRTVSGGSREYWWRPGAPLALVLDTITPALVYELHEPFTMPPGEQIVVEVEVPGSAVGQGQDQPTFHIGVSLNGFAAIEG